MSDPINRQDAIDALCDNCDNVQAVCPHYPCKQYTAIEGLPSAEPKIIHCKDCTHFHYDFWADVYGVSMIVGHEVCDFWGNGCKTTEDGFCAYGERIEE